MAEFDPVQWLNGLPRAASITDAEVRRIWELAREMPEGAMFVELGVWQGRSACLLAKAAMSRRGYFYGIDHFEHPGCSQAEVIARFRERGLDECGVILRGHTEQIAHGWGNLAIDFLHIDADHSSPGIDRDCDRFLPLVKPGGIVAFDDYAQLASEPHYPDVKRVADRDCPATLWEDLGTADGMKFFRRKP